jgi:peptidoglycan/LPS O-acetylase OafA/YrhL
MSLLGRARKMYGKDRNLLIDCLRGFSILIVVASHGALDTLPGQYLGPIRVIVKGYYGVAVFFTISGFLITRNVLKRYGKLDRVDFRQFYTMRIARIIPCLLLFLSVMTLLFWFGVEGFVPAEPRLVALGFFSAIFFQYNNFYVTAGNVPGMFAWSPLWSLSIEETFYLSFPIVCLISRKHSSFVAVLLALIAYGPLVRMEPVGIYHYFGNADLLAFGCLAAILERQFSKSIGLTIAAALGAAGAVTVLATFILVPVDAEHFWAPSVVAIGAASFLLGATSLPYFKPWRAISFVTTTCSAFGRASYEIYLFHVALIIAFNAALPLLFGKAQMGSLTSVGITVFFLSVVLAFGAIISRFFTEPLNQIIRKARWPVRVRLPRIAH